MQARHNSDARRYCRAQPRAGFTATLMLLRLLIWARAGRALRSVSISPFIIFAPGWAACSPAYMVHIPASEAVPASVVLDSMGVNTHFGFSDSPYALRYKEVRTKLVALGLTHVRDVLNEHVGDLAKAGIRTTVLAEPNTNTPQGFRDRIKRLNRTTLCVDSIEGANEADMFWPRLHISWHGQGYPLGPVLWQHDLYRTFKSDPATVGLTMIGPSLGLAGMPNATPPVSWKGLRKFVDWGDFHPYSYNGNPFAPELKYGTLPSFFHNGTFPSVGLDESPVAYRAYRDIYASGPMAATEAGYPTAPGFTSEELQAKYIPRMFLEDFRLGIKRTYLYQFLDNTPNSEPGDPDESFGLLRYDLSEKPAYGALKVLTAMLLRVTPSGRAISSDFELSLTIAGVTEFPDASRVHHLLIRRKDGTLLLLLWHEVSGEDTSSHPHRPVVVPPLPGRLSTNTPAHMVILNMPTRTRAGNAFASSLNVDIPDAVIAVSISL